MASFLAQLRNVRLRECTAPREASLKDRIGIAREEGTTTPRISYQEARAMAGIHGTSSSAREVKVMVLQRNCISPAELDKILSQEAKSRKADILVLPEGAHHEGGIASLADNALLRELAAVIRKHQLYAVLGTMGETAAGGDHHCTALVVGPSGELVATYRKRAVLSVRQVPGKGPCTFNTHFGKVGVMICYDAENPSIVAEALESDPVLMINPVHISAGRIGVLMHGKGVRCARNAQWRHALESTSRYMDHLVKSHGRGLAWVRCDQPYPIGAGTSQVITPGWTQHVETSGTTNWSVILRLRDSEERLPKTFIARPPPRERTHEVDNCGNRYTLRGAAVNTTANELAFATLSSSREYPLGLVKLLDKKSMKLVATIDIHRMLAVTRSDIKEMESKLKIETCRIGKTPFRITRSADCNSIQLIHGEGTGTNVECHHVFPAPYARILSLAYLDEQGVIIAFSTTSANEGPAQKRAINIWQFTQHRHAVALHDMLS